MIMSNHEKLQREHNAAQEDLTKIRFDLGQIQKSEVSLKEQVNRKQ